MHACKHTHIYNMMSSIQEIHNGMINMPLLVRSVMTNFKANHDRADQSTELGTVTSWYIQSDFRRGVATYLSPNSQ